jgi:DcaP outer membrane protein
MDRGLHLALRTLVGAAALLAWASTSVAQTAPPAPGETEVSEEPPEGEPAQKPEQTVPRPEDGFRMGAFTFKPGGRIKLDVIRDFKPIGSEESFDTRTIPVDGSEGTNSTLHAKESRLNLDIRGDVEGQQLRMYVETDFFSSGSGLRLRHAYGSYGGLLAGQTWSTFVDEDNMPRTIDFESPTAYASIRQALVRWTATLGDGLIWSVAVEDNKSNITVPEDIPGKAEYLMPDIVTRFRFNFDRAHVSTAAFVGASRFRPEEGDEVDTVTLWGGMVSAKLNLFANDSIYGVVTVGEGIGRYRGGITAVPDERGRLHPVGGVAFMGGYEHFWNERLSSNAVYSIADTSDEPFYDSSINKQLDYGAINLLYWFLGDRAWTGIEYLYGRREVFGQGNANGESHRIQYAVRFNLP